MQGATVLTLNLEAAARTHVGLLRVSNQDHFGIDAELGLYVVCDGMGGAAGGEVASFLAVETFLAIARQEIQSSTLLNGAGSSLALQRAVAAANRAVLARAHWDTIYRGMGSTLVAARITAGTLCVINLGDSRAYLVRDGHATQLTQDHSFVAESVRLGTMAAAEAETSPLQSVITRAIGVEPDARPDLYEVALQPGDRLLLASDGLTRHVLLGELAEVVSVAPSADDACDLLVDLALRRGGSDNITCVVVCAL
jgi:serine/threonine protein phosphatase PrpC